MRVEKELVVNAPIEMVYQLWTDFERFPRFMGHVESVTKTGEGTYHWKAKIGPREVEWDSKVVGLVPNRSVTWRSTSGSENAGAVNLAAQGTLTLMQVVIEYHPSWFEGLLDTVTHEMSRSVEGDLDRFKRLAEPEDGEMVTRAASEPDSASSAGAQGTTSESVGSGNSGAHGPSSARAGVSETGMADAAPLSRSGAMAGGHEGGGGYATGGATVGSMGGTSRSGSMGSDAPEPVTSASEMADNPDESTPDESGVEDQDLSARSGEYNPGQGVPPVDETARTEPPVAVSGSHKDPDAADQPAIATPTPGSGEAAPPAMPGMDTTGITGPSLYTDEAAGYRDYSGTAGETPSEGTTGEAANPAAEDTSGAAESPIEEERGTAPGMVGGTGGWGSSTGGSPTPSGAIGPGSSGRTSASGGFDQGPARGTSTGSDIGRGSDVGEVH